MSHFTKIKTQFKSRQHLLAALNELGLAPEVTTSVGSGGVLELKTNWSDRNVMADIAVRKSVLGVGADVGFRWSETDNCFEVIADDYELRKSSCKVQNFRQRLSEEYAVQVAVSSGYQVVSRTTAGDGRMQVRLKPKQLLQVRR